MAARFDATRRELGQVSGDGTPIMLTIPVDEPWVPLRILSLGLGRNDVIDADVFLLTDDLPTLTADERDFDLVRKRRPVEPARRPALRQGHGLGPRGNVAHVPAGRRARPRVGGDLAVSTEALAAGPAHGRGR